MKIPALRGTIRRRLLLNYRIDPDRVRKLLPANFRPKLVNGYAIGGICLIRLERIRPKGLPGLFGIASENAAHRFAVEWESPDGEPCEGVFVPRRDTGSRINALAGGRLFPGVHHLAQFTVRDREGRITFKASALRSGDLIVDLEATETDAFPESSVFASLAESSAFFEAGCVGYSARPDACTLDGLLLKVSDWVVSPLYVQRIQSFYFDDETLFPAGSIQFDHALLMRDVAHEWHSEPEMVS